MSPYQVDHWITKNQPQQLPTTPDPGALKLNFSRDVLASRPSLPRTLSKRHASFDSPREIPLPSPSLMTPNSSQFSYFPDVGQAEPGLLSKSRPANLSNNNFSPVFDEQADEAGWTELFTPKKRPDHQRNPSASKTATARIPSPSNIPPYPRPYSVPNNQSSASTPYDVPASKKSRPCADRTSSVSLPLPSQIPFHALPKVGSRNKDDGSREEHGNDHHEMRSSSPSDDSTGTSTVKNSRSPSPTHGSSNAGTVTGGPSHPRLRDPPSITHQSPSPDPPETTSLGAATAMHHSVAMSCSPEPPTILPIPPLPASPTPATPPQNNPSDPHSPSLMSTPASPTRPTTSQPPYTAFLSHAPPPPDSWIQVETTPSDYRLNVRLPGFQRDGITLASKKRRILHIVADSWGSGGGHFERRIALGYDADFGRIHAEFDGEMLRIVVPRRAVQGMRMMGYAV